MRISPSRSAAVLAAATGLALTAVAPALATGGYTVPLHQDVPITATGGTEPCPGIPSTQDGWHFVLPGKDAGFVSLTVTFSPGGTQTVTTFSGPHNMQAYVGSAPGAKLTSATAQVQGGAEEWFNLSHTCKATPVSTPPSSPAPSTPPSSSPSTPASPSASTSTSPSASASASASVSTSASASASAASTPSASASATVAAGSGGLASTGANVIGAAVAGVVLVGVGGVLVMRRRKGTHQA